MTITVTENPVGIRQSWAVPSTIAPGVPVGALTFQNVSVVIAASTAERTAVSINCALDIGWTYRLVEARIVLNVASASDDEWGNFAEGQIVLANPSNPSLDSNIPFELSAGQPGQIGLPTDPNNIDASALPFKMMFGPLVPLPNTPLPARGATSVCRLFFGSNIDSNGASSFSYFLRFLIYTINDDESYAINSPVPVTF